MTQVYHAKLLVKQHMYEDAMIKFEDASTMEPKNKCTVSLGMADCLRLKGDYKQALEHYNYVSMNQVSLQKDLSIKKAICFIELIQYDKAISELDLVKFLLN